MIESDPAVQQGDAAYRNYWRRKQLLGGSFPPCPVIRWWGSESLCEVEQVIYTELSGAASLLDFGAGDLRFMKRLRQAGYTGEYHTLDIGEEFEHTYRDVAEVKRQYDAILCLDVIEHLPLNAGLELLQSLTNLLSEGGVLVVQTPNARCVRFPLSWDMTHLHCYNAPDLWAYLTCLDLTVKPYRVAFRKLSTSPVERLRTLCAYFVITRFLGGDYADNILLLGRKRAG